MVRVAGIPFVISSVEAATDWLLHVAAPGRIAVNVRLANAFNIALTDREASYRRLFRDEGVNFPDGTPVVWAMRLRTRRGGSVPSRVRGPSLFVASMRKSASLSTRHFLLGSTPSTLALLESEIARRFPGVAICGSYSPPFAPIDSGYIADCAEKVRSAKPDIIWLGLGTPKQDILGSALAGATETPTVNVGAAFDYVAGTVREAPRLVQRSGFEWLYRLVMEPRRLWRRYLIGNAQFVWVVFKSWRSDRL